MNATPNASLPPVANASVDAITGGAKKKAATVKKLLCGRERLVTKEGRSSFVVISGSKYTMSEAKAMDAQWRKEKKEKEAAKKAKASAKAKKAKAAKKA